MNAQIAFLIRVGWYDAICLPYLFFYYVFDMRRIFTLFCFWWSY